jgi:hypothetical protein
LNAVTKKGVEGTGKRSVILLIAEAGRTNEVVERIRSLLARFSENEETVRRLVATDARFDALCHEYRKVVELLDDYQGQVKFLAQRRALLEEELLTRIEGHQPR